jgi:hypothetical protein
MKIQAFIFCIGLLTASCTSLPKSGTEKIPPDAKDVVVDASIKPEKTGDRVSIKFAEQVGDFLKFDVSYSGGCEEHVFDLISNGNYEPTYPPEIEIGLKHNANNDHCRSVIDKKIYFDISQLQYQGTNKVLLVITNTNKTLEYTY